MIFFETERLILRNYTMDDVPAVHEYFSKEDADGNPIMIKSRVYKLTA